MADRMRSWWGWGWEDQALTADQFAGLAGLVGSWFGSEGIEIHHPPALDSLALRRPRVAPPGSLQTICRADSEDRAAHTHGKAFRDVVRNLLGQLDDPPDVVAHPATEVEVGAVLDWCSTAGLAAIPYGGGSSVTGGVEARVGEGYPGVVSIDLTGLDRVLEIDRTSRAARIQGGALGPILEDQLRPHGLTLRHFPQSFEFSTLGGWLATRAGGHFATVYTHIDDLVESIRAITPAGVFESRRLPGSGAGPSPDRMLLGSEGTLGVITEAWMRLQDRPRWRGSASVHFDRHQEAVEATRAIAQAALYPTNCRLLDSGEALLSAGTQVSGGLLVLGFESADHPVDTWLERCLELCRDHHGTVPDEARYSDDGGATAAGDQAGPASRAGASGTWRNTFLRAPYTRDALVRMGVIVETFETSCTWDRFDEFHAAVTEAANQALQRVCGAGLVTCRFTHVYPDGPAPYYSVFGPGRWGSQVSQWDEIKAAVSEAVLNSGGTITHHHSVGRDHRPWYDRQRPDPFANALRAAKASLDPSGILNPGVLIDPPR
ncbi:MAG TPA: FAD-binding oxidoreductase [Acidimicrobiales bacterium]|nr:FAD-binding oxidoreductase [Acidimicrobiales bacterium]